MGTRTYTAAEREHALALYVERGPAAAARATAIPPGTIRSWAKRSGAQPLRDEQTRAASAAARLTWEQRRAELTVRLGEVAAGLLERAAAGEAQEAKALMTACAIGIDKAEHRSTPTHPGERIAAARLGFGPVTALDSDPLAIEATTANARQNGVVLDRVERANLREQAPPQADVVLANLMRPLLLRVAELMPEPPRALIASGLLDHEADKVAAAFSPLRERRRVIDKGWGALLLRAP